MPGGTQLRISGYVQAQKGKSKTEPDPVQWGRRSFLNPTGNQFFFFFFFELAKRLLTLNKLEAFWLRPEWRPVQHWAWMSMNLYQWFFRVFLKACHGSGFSCDVKPPRCDWISGVMLTGADNRISKFELFSCGCFQTATISRSSESSSPRGT